MQTRAALEEVFPQSPNANARVQMRLAEAVAQRAQGIGDLLPLGSAQLRDALLKTGKKIDPHNLPVNALLWPATRALRTSARTLRKARSACFSVAPYSCST